MGFSSGLHDGFLMFVEYFNPFPKPFKCIKRVAREETEAQRC